MLPQSLRTMLVVLVSVSLLAGLGRAVGAEEGGQDPDKPKAEEGKDGDGQPDVAPPGETAKPAAGDTAGAAEKPQKRIWAQSLLFCDAPEVDVSTWLTDKPELKGKFVLIEFWRTWCGACKRSVPLLNSFHEKFGKELVVIAITGEPEEKVKAYGGPEMKYAMAIDAAGMRTQEEDAIKDQGATEEKFGVWGWPHVVLLEPEHHCVIWEGFPLLKGYELTAEKIEKALAIGRARQKEEK